MSDNDATTGRGAVPLVPNAPTAETPGWMDVMRTVDNGDDVRFYVGKVCEALAHIEAQAREIARLTAALVEADDIMRQAGMSIEWQRKADLLLDTEPLKRGRKMAERLRKAESTRNTLLCQLLCQRDEWQRNHDLDLRLIEDQRRRAEQAETERDDLRRQLAEAKKA